MTQTNSQDFSPLECDPSSNPRKVSSEAQDGEKTVSPNLTIAALTANLFYAEALKQQAYLAHKDALIKYAQVLDALNQAIVSKNK